LAQIGLEILRDPVLGLVHPLSEVGAVAELAKARLGTEPGGRDRGIDPVAHRGRCGDSHLGYGPFSAAEIAADLIGFWHEFSFLLVEK
jgi:hypothetical protein